LARDFSSSRRAPPNAASKWCCSSACFKLYTEPLRLAVAEGDHLAELPGGIDMQEREWRLPGIERLHGEMHHDRRVLADRIEHHWVVELRHHLAHDLDAFRLELAEIG